MSNALPDGWIAVTLDDVVEVRDFEREPINSSERSGRLEGKSKADLFPYYGATGQVGWIDDYRSEGEQVLLGEDGAPFLDPHRNKAYIVSGRYWVNNHAHVLRGIEGGMQNRFLVHQLNFVDYHDFVTGSTRLKLTSSAMKRIPLFLPPLAEQSRIVEKLEELLSDLDAGVAELKAAQRKLAQYRQSLLKAAVEGALTADWRAAQSTSSRRRPGPSRSHEDQPQQRDPGLRRDDEGKETGAELLQRILRERRARWEQKQLAKFAEQGKTPPKDWQEKYPEPVSPDLTNLPPLPEGWVWASVDQVVSESLIGLDRGQEHQSESGSVSYIKMNNISMDGDVDLRNLVKIEADQFEIERYAVESGDLLFNTRNSKELVGKVGIVRSPSPMTVYNNNLMRIRFDGVVLPQFACHQLCGPEFRGRMERIKKATTSVAAVYAKDFFPLAFAVPPENEQKEIESCLDAAFEKIDQQRSAIEKAIAQSESQRKSILKAAFSGQLVPQDPNDEPASELLARIRAECISGQARKPHQTKKKSRKAV